MFRISKKVEYALMALQHLAQNGDQKHSAKQLAENLDISFDFLAKALQTLMKNGIVVSQQGIKGGYTLSRSANEISISEVIKAMEENFSVVDCLATNLDECCSRANDCSIKTPLSFLQDKVDNVFHSMTIADMTNPGAEDDRTELNREIA
jgi:Rrf2 family protein